MDNLLKNTLEKIETEAGHSHLNLKESCREAIVKIERLSREDEPLNGDNDERNDLFEPLLLACKTEDFTILQLALDAISKLCAHSYFLDKVLDDSVALNNEYASDKKKTFADLVVQTVCSCSLDTPQVQLQVIQALLTLITSSTLAVHDFSLLNAVRTIYTVHLSTQSPVNKLTARASLQQLITFVFSAMEKYDLESDSISQQSSENETNVEVMSNEEDDIVEKKSISASDPLDTIDLNDEGPVSEKVEKKEEMANKNKEKDETYSQKTSELNTIYHRDAFLLFRSLCKLSNKAMEDGTSLPEVRQIESKVLSLDLILCIIDHAGQCFLSSETFKTAIKTYLCPALYSNGANANSGISGLSLRCFNRIYRHFKTELGNELMIFMQSAYIPVLEHGNFPQTHKLLALEIVTEICDSSTGLRDMFLNFDVEGGESEAADPSEMFSRLVGALASASKGRISQNEVTQNQIKLAEEMKVKKEATKCLISVVKSMSELFGSDGLDDSSPSEDNLAQIEEFHNGIVEKLGNTEKKSVDNEILVDVPLNSKAEFDSMDEAKFASYLKNTQNLNKVAMGNYLGAGAEFGYGFCTKVLKSYLKLFDFEGKPFAASLQSFLKCFTIPTFEKRREKILENFAHSFYQKNVGLFSTADSAFLLSIEVIKLGERLKIAQNVKIELIKENFLNLNENRIELCSEVANKNESFLEHVFDWVKDNWDVEACEGLLDFEEESPTLKKFYISAMFEVAWWPILGSFSHILERLGGVDVWLEGSSTTDIAILEKDIVLLCLKGFEEAIRLAALCVEKEKKTELKITRTTLVNSLMKFTLLEGEQEMSRKSVECTRSILNMSNQNILFGESWETILAHLHKISRLLQITEVRAAEDRSNSLNDSDSVTSSEFAQSKATLRNPTLSMSETIWMTSGFFSRSADTNEAAKSLFAKNSNLMKTYIEHDIVKRLYENTVNLSKKNALDFVKQLCVVGKNSLKQKKDSNPPESEDLESKPMKFFNLEKLIEVSVLNMEFRSRTFWFEMWEIIGSHLYTLGLNEDFEIAKHGLLGLRKLSKKFFEIEELPNFNFQNRFLDPFERIMIHCDKIETRKFLVRCIDHMIRFHSSMIRSGWISFLSVLSIAAKDPDNSVAQLGWPILNDLAMEHIEKLTPYFLNMVKCFFSYVEGSHEDLAMAAVARIATISKFLNPEKGGKGLDIPSPLTKSHLSSRFLYEEGEENEDRDVRIELWWPILAGLGHQVRCSSSPLRHGCLDILTRILNEDGELFDSGVWGNIFKGVLLPIMEGHAVNPMKRKKRAYLPEDSIDNNGVNENGWVNDIAPRVFGACSELFFSFGGRTEKLLDDMLRLFHTYICQSDETLARIALSAFAEFIFKLEVREEERNENKSSGDLFESVDSADLSKDQISVWGSLTSSLASMLVESLPNGIIETSEGLSNAVHDITTPSSRENMLQNRESKNSLTHSNAPIVSPLNIPLWTPSGLSSAGESSLLETDALSVESEDPKDALRAKMDESMTKLVIAPRLLLYIQALVCCHSRAGELSPENVETLFQAIEESAKACRKFNTNFTLRRALGRAGFLTKDGVPKQSCEMLNQEMASYTTMLECLVSLQSYEELPGISARIGAFCKEIINMFIARQDMLQGFLENGAVEGELGGNATLCAQGISSLEPIVVRALETMKSLSNEDLEGEESWVHKSLVGLITTDSAEIRRHVAEILMQRENL